MKHNVLFQIALALPSLTAASICNNNCGRQVVGTARKDPSLSSRSSLCAAFVTTTVTEAGAAPSAAKRNVHGPRQAFAPVITGTKPAYASSCPDVTAYWSACQCFEGVKATTITVVGPGPSSTSSVSPSSTISDSPVSPTPEPPSPTFTSTTTTSSSASTPTCTPGLEYALYSIDRNSDLCQNYINVQGNSPRNFNLNRLIGGRTPVLTGVTQSIGFSNNGDEALAPLRLYGTQGPAGTTSTCSIVQHRGYINVTPGVYTVFANQPDDDLLLWFGNNAKSGSFAAGNSDVYGLWASPEQSKLVDTFVFTESAYIPFRVYWDNRGGPGDLKLEVKNSTGDVILGFNTQQSQNVVYKCAGGDAPAFPAWQDEAVAGG
ncbi:hypothetical protein GCG54_00006081 [Colletotrichum gloeosporioides]|uniref:GLEYA adhesin domain-containing protein n=1 Tax=Colletotrichum gloeosporioides TaxID=474922 RepID=A0A8H4CLX2_COLGL|nr:uncharacterized protein GCG54_00006081 [Colletotrichum gloeosporioides]KAF3806319.1 hypothetical protein GCG54_00006081 [Colletotrichum gloeosporioides]